MDYYELFDNLAEHPLSVHERQVFDYLCSLQAEEFTVVKPSEVSLIVGFSAAEVCWIMGVLRDKGFIRMQKVDPRDEIIAKARRKLARRASLRC